MLGHFRRKLVIRHPVSRLHFDDEAMEFLALDSLVQLAFGFTGAEDQNRF